MEGDPATLSIVRWSYLLSYRLLVKTVSFWEVFASKRYICCALTILYST